MAKYDVDESFELLLDELGKFIEGLSDQGVLAFKQHNYEDARKLSQAGTDLEKFREKVIALQDEWHASFNDDIETTEDYHQKDGLHKPLGRKGYNQIEDYIIPVLKMLRQGDDHAYVFNKIADKLGVNYSTVLSQCTRGLGLKSLEEFLNLVSIDKIIPLLRIKYPDQESLIDSELNSYRSNASPVVDEEITRTGQSNYSDRLKKIRTIPQRIPMVLLDIFLVYNRAKGLNESYNDAIIAIAKERKKYTTTINDHCTRSIGLKAYDFKELLQSERRLRIHLIGRYPNYSEIINDIID